MPITVRCTCGKKYGRAMPSGNAQRSVRPIHCLSAARHRSAGVGKFGAHPHRFPSHTAQLTALVVGGLTVLGLILLRSHPRRTTSAMEPEAAGLTVAWAAPVVYSLTQGTNGRWRIRSDPGLSKARRRESRRRILRPVLVLVSACRLLRQEHRRELLRHLRHPRAKSMPTLVRWIRHRRSVDLKEAQGHVPPGVDEPLMVSRRLRLMGRRSDRGPI